MAGFTDRVASPFSDTYWFDIREAIGVTMGMAVKLNETRPRRKPPEGHDAVIEQALNAVRAYTGIPELSKFGEEGVQVSDAFWHAKAAYSRLINLYERVDEVDTTLPFRFGLVNETHPPYIAVATLTKLP